MVYEAHKRGGASAGPVVSSSGKLLVYLRDWRGETAIEEVEEAGGGSAGQWKVVEQLAREGRRELEPFAAQFYRLQCVETAGGAVVPECEDVRASLQHVAEIRGAGFTGDDENDEPSTKERGGPVLKRQGSIANFSRTFSEQIFATLSSVERWVMELEKKPDEAVLF
jgi:hypothetical protein